MTGLETSYLYVLLAFCGFESCLEALTTKMDGAAAGSLSSYGRLAASTWLAGTESILILVRAPSTLCSLPFVSLSKTLGLASSLHYVQRI